MLDANTDLCGKRTDHVARSGGSPRRICRRWIPPLPEHVPRPRHRRPPDARPRDGRNSGRCRRTGRATTSSPSTASLSRIRRIGNPRAQFMRQLDKAMQGRSARHRIRTPGIRRQGRRRDVEMCRHPVTLAEDDTINPYADGNGHLHHLGHLPVRPRPQRTAARHRSRTGAQHRRPRLQVRDQQPVGRRGGQAIAGAPASTPGAHSPRPAVRRSAKTSSAGRTTCRFTCSNAPEWTRRRRPTSGGRRQWVCGLGDLRQVARNQRRAVREFGRGAPGDRCQTPSGEPVLPNWKRN